jgi:hypothetical protein
VSALQDIHQHTKGIIPHKLSHILCVHITKAIRLDSRGLGTDVLDGDLDVLLSEVHLTSESAVRLPLAGGAGSGLLQHLVDLLEGEALGLRDEEEGEED